MNQSCPDSLSLKPYSHKLGFAACTNASAQATKFGDETLLSVGQAMLGMASVVCPAAHVGKGTILGGQASAEAGSDLTAQMLYLGAPATALFKSPVRLGVGSLCAPCPACHERNSSLVNGQKRRETRSCLEAGQSLI